MADVGDLKGYAGDGDYGWAASIRGVGGVDESGVFEE